MSLDPVRVDVKPQSRMLTHPATHFLDKNYSRVLRGEFNGRKGQEARSSPGRLSSCLSPIQSRHSYLPELVGYLLCAHLETQVENCTDAYGSCLITSVTALPGCLVRSRQVSPGHAGVCVHCMHVHVYACG